MIGIVDNTVQSITRVYDTLGRPTKVTSHGNATDDPTDSSNIKSQIVYTLGSEGLVTKTEQSHSGAVTTGTPAVQYGYDDTATSNVYANGLRLQTTTYPNGRVVYNDYGSNDAVFDRLDRVYRLRETSSSGSYLTEYSYSGTSRLATMYYSQPDVQLDLFQGTSGTYKGYDRFGRTIDHKWYDLGAAANVARIKYGYDFVGSRTWREDAAAAAHSQNHDEFYAYDGLQRLVNFDRGDLTGTPPTGISGTPAKEEDWTLDQLGNWPGLVRKSAGATTLNQTRTHNAVNEIQTLSTSVTPAHDAAGNMTYAALGPGADPCFLVYDAWNRLRRIVLEADDKTIANHKYDGLGRRIRQDFAGSSDDLDYYYNEAWQLLEERKGGDTDPLGQYVWHPYYIDALAVRYYDSTTGGTQVRQWYAQDANYNVTAVLNDSASVQERYSYTPYGEVTFLNADFSTKSTQATAIGNNHLYTGRELDPETGLQLNRRRFYASWMGRWVTRDPIVYQDSFNLYEFINSRPLTYLDPSGEGVGDFWEKQCKTKCQDICKGSKGTTCITECYLFCEGAQKLGKKLCEKPCDALFSWCFKQPGKAKEACLLLHQRLCPGK